MIVVANRIMEPNRERVQQSNQLTSSLDRNASNARLAVGIVCKAFQQLALDI